MPPFKIWLYKDTNNYFFIKFHTKCDMKSYWIVLTKKLR